MGDLSLDLDRTSEFFGDLVLDEGDLLINEGIEAIQQNIIQRLKTYLGEWFLDNQIGLPYYEQILVKNPDIGKVDALFQNAILGTPGVLSLDTYRAVFDKATRRFSVAFKATCTSGQVDYAGLL